MKQIHLDIKVALKCEDNGVISWLKKSRDNAAPVNGVANSMIKSLHLYLNDVLINSNADNYHLKSYIQTLYTYDKQQKRSYLKPSGWYQDTTSYFNDMGSTTNPITSNTGYYERKQLFMTQNKQEYAEYGIHFITKLSTDFLGSTNGLLIPGVEVRLELELNPPEIYMMSNTLTQGTGSDRKTVKYFLDIKDIRIHVPVCTMSQESFIRFNSTIQHKPAIYTLRKSMIIPHSISKGSTSYFNDCLFACSEQPSRFGLAIVKTAAYKGDYGLVGL